MRSVLLAAAVLSLGMIISAGEVRADLTYSDGGVHAISTILPPETVNLSNSTTLNVVAGGSITGGNVSGAYGISASWSTVNVNGGTVTGGSVSGTDAILAEWSTVNIYAGSTISTGYSTDPAVSGRTINLYGGTVIGDIYGTAQTTISGGTVTGDLHGESGDKTTISGGTISGGVYNHGSTTTVTGGKIMGIVRTDGGVTTINGGDIDGGIYAHAGGATNIYGGTIIDLGDTSVGLLVDASTVNIYGSNFDYAYGNITGGSGTLTGTLSDGTAIDLTFQIRHGGGGIVLYPVPEPAALSLLVLGGLAMVRRRK